MIRGFDKEFNKHLKSMLKSDKYKNLNKQDYDLLCNICHGEITRIIGTYQLFGYEDGTKFVEEVINKQEAEIERGTL